MFIFPSGIPSGAGGYQPAGALYLDGSADYLSWTPSNAASSNTDKTISFWVKRAKFGSVQWILDVSSNGDQIQYTAGDKLEVSLNATIDTHYTTTAVYRDPTAWTNVVVAFDTDNGTAANRKRLWINGVLQEDADLDNHDDPSDGDNVDWMKQSIAHNIGRRGNNSQFFEGYLADFIGIDGALDADSFGETNSSGIWVPKDPSGLTFGNNGFWLDFSDGRYPGLDVQASSTGEESTISFLHHFAGDDGDTHTAGDASTRAAKDSSSRNHSMTYFGNAQIDTAQSKFSGSSVYFDGAGDGITVNNGSEAFTFPGDFTIEMWVRFPAINTSSGQAGANSQLITNRTSGNDYWSLQWEWLSSIGVRFYVVSGGSVTANMQQGSNSGWSTNTWYHVAVVRNGGTVNIYRDGTSIASSTAFGTGSIGGYNDVCLGNYTSSTSGDGSFYGWMDELRISKRAVYKANFTAPSSAFSDPPAGNHFTPTSIDADNFVVDGPVNSTDKEISIHPTIDPVGPWGVAENTLSNNNLTWVSGGSSNKWNYSTMPISNTDKVYFEVHQSGNCGGSHTPGFSITKRGHPGGDTYPGAQTDNSDWGFYLGNGSSTTAAAIIVHDASFTLNNQAGGANGDVYQVARDGASLWFGRNNTWYNSGDPTDATTGIYKSGSNPLPTDEPLWVAFHSYGTQATLTWKPYSGDWTYSPPSGFGEMKSTIIGTGNAATLNPIASSNRKGGLSNGNLTASGNGKDNFSTMAIPLTGKWYFEATLTTAGASKDAVGVAEAKADQLSEYGSKVVVLYGSDSTKFLGSNGPGDWETYTGAATYTSGDTIGVYVNAGQVTFYKNGTSQGTCGSAFTTQCFATSQNTHANTIWNLNFGQKPFIHTPPTDAKALTTQNITSGFTGSLSNVIVTTNATESNIKSTTEGAHSFSNWISILYNRDASEQRIFYASDDSSNYIPFCDDGVLGKNSFPTLSGSNNWTGCAIATGASTGIATGTISHSNGSDSSAAHGLTSSTSRFAILISSEATSSHDGWFWFHPAMTANNNIRMAQGGSEAQQSSKYYAEVTSSNAVVKSAAPTGTYRYIVFAENDLISLYSYTNMASDSDTGIFVETNNKPEWMLWSQMTETGGGYGSHLAWKGTHNPHNPWTKYTRLHNISTNELTEDGAIITANGFKSTAALSLGAWRQANSQTTCGISIGTPFPLNNRAR